MTPEERHAARLIKDMGLKPPIDIKALLSEFADIEYDRLPAGVDAVLLRKQIKKNRPLVVVDRSKPAKRQRFTLAHEFGHILIPWHIGTISCHTSLTGAFGEYLYRETESEANRFASELLMPVGWMKQIIEKHESIADIFREVRQADVSGISAGISLCKVLPSGFVFVAADNNNKILARAKSANTAARLMDREGRFDKSFYQGTGAKPVA